MLNIQRDCDRTQWQSIQVGTLLAGGVSDFILSDDDTKLLMISIYSIKTTSQDHGITSLVYVGNEASMWSQHIVVALVTAGGSPGTREKSYIMNYELLIEDVPQTAAQNSENADWHAAMPACGGGH